MGTYINIGKAGFQSARNGEYVDKSGLRNRYKYVNRSKELPLGKLPLGNIMYICGIKFWNRYILTFTIILAAWLAGGNAMAQDAQQPTGVVVGGSVYGGGNNADVKINTTVNISTGTVVHNVYGGGRMGSVGTLVDARTEKHDAVKKETYASTGDEYDGAFYNFGMSWPYKFVYATHTFTDENEEEQTAYTGLATVNITGGSVDYVYGGGKGNAGGKEGETEPDRYKEALVGNVRETQVNIGTLGEGTQPTIGHSVYGGAEDGHVYENTNVTINGGTISHSLFGGGKGEGQYSATLWEPLSSAPTDTDQHQEKSVPELIHSWTAGKVYGNTNVTMYGGSVGYNVYGGGNLGSVGKGNYAGGNDDYSTPGYGELPPSSNLSLWENSDFTQSGKAIVKIYSGTIGTENVNYGDLPTGNVFGSSRGKAALDVGRRSPRYMYVPDFYLGYVNETEITIGSDDANYAGSAPIIYGSVYGGGQDGHVRRGTHIIINKGTIGVSGSEDADRGNVFGAGSGIGTYTDIYDSNKTKCSNSSGSVTCTTNVEIKGTSTTTTIYGNVYGGGALASVGPPFAGNMLNGAPYDELKETTTDHLSNSYTQVNVQGGSIGGSVYGASRGPSDALIESVFSGTYDATDATKFATSIWSDVNVTGAAAITGSVYGGGELGIVKHATNVNIGTTGSSGAAFTGTIGKSVFGGGKEAMVGGSVTVNMNSGTVTEDVYGGGALAHTNTNKEDRTLTGAYLTSDETTNGIKTTVNLLGGQLRDAYGGALGQVGRAAGQGVSALEDIPAYVYGDVKVELNHNTNSTLADGSKKGCIVERVFGCNNLNGTPKGHVQVYVYATQNVNKPETSENQIISAKFPPHNGEETGSTSTYDVKAVYGGGNLSPYDPTDAHSSTTALKEAARTEVYIYGCGLTSIKQVYAGGNAASAPATLVRVLGAYEIEEVFGGGNGKDKYVLNGDYYENPGANVGYYNYTQLDGSGDGTQGSPYGCEEKDDAKTKEDRQDPDNGYVYGSGIATTEIYGGKIHYVYGGSNERGNIREEAMSLYEEMDEDCPIVTDQTYGGGKNSIIDGRINLDLGCVNEMAEIFGGSKNADVNSDIVLKITNGTYQKVFGGNNTSGAINGSITVIIKEQGCSPIRIGELYLGGYLAPYSVYGYQQTNGVYDEEDVPYIDDNGVTQTLKQRIPLTSLPSGGTKKYDPRIYVISASRIDNIFGGGYQAKVVGDTHINVNMENGKILAQYVDAESFVGNHTDEDNNILWVGERIVESDDPTKRDGILAIGTIGNIYGGGNMADIVGNTSVEIGTGYWHQEQTDDVWETIGTDGVTYTYDETDDEWSGQKTTGETTETVTSEKAPEPARNAATITGNVFGGGKGKADTYECDKAMVGVPDGTDNTIGNTSVIIGNGTVGPVDATGAVGRQVDANGKVIGGNVYGGGEVGRVEYNTKVTIGLDPEKVEVTSAPVIGGDVYGAGAGVETHGYSALVRGNADVTVQADAKVNGNVYGGGEIATVGKYWVKGVNYPSTLNPPTPPSDDVLSNFMPYAPRSGGICTVVVKDNAVIGDGSTGGNVFGAGKGVDPAYFYDYSSTNGSTNINRWSKRMTNYTNSSDFPNNKINITWKYIKEYTSAEIADDNITKYVWEYFDTEAKYLTFLETLALASETDVTIGETSGSETVTVNGSVYGGSENGFVQTNTDVDIQSTSEIGENVFGGGKGTEKHDGAGRVKGNTDLAISGGTIAGNVYGGGELGHVGTFTETTDGRYVMQQIKDVNGDDINTGKCTVAISGGTVVGPNNNTDREKGNVFGAGKGKDDNFKCDKAMAMETSVSISSGTVNGNVYGGGEIGRVEYDTEVKIGNGEGTGGSSVPTINGSVFGAGRGVATHGYSALVRKDTKVTVEGDAHVGHSVYGGGEIASVGKYGLNAQQMPNILLGGGKCIVKVQGHAVIAGDVFGAGKGVTPDWFYDYDSDTEATNPNKDSWSKRMMKYSAGFVSGKVQGRDWDYIKVYTQAELNNDDITKFIWDYLTTEEAYTTYLETLALATNPEVTIDGNASVNGSVFGGGELGLTKGSVIVTVNDGTIEEDVYGGGSLANTNTTHLVGRVVNDVPVKDSNDEYVTDPVYPTTTVTLKGGTINRNVYGGGLGRIKVDEQDAVYYTQEEADAYNQEHNLQSGADGFVTTETVKTPAVEAVSEVKAKVYGNVLVTLNGIPTEQTVDGNKVVTYAPTGDCVVKGSIFGCNNANGSPQKAVTVHIYKTQGYDGHMRTAATALEDPADANHSYELLAVYGGGNQAAFRPDDELICDTVQPRVIIDGCDLTSIKTVYGGGNAASVPATNVTINGTYEIEEVFGGGNGYGTMPDGSANPGANVGYTYYDPQYDPPAPSKEYRTEHFGYGCGKANVKIVGGRVHRVFGGSNTKGNVRESAVTILQDIDGCHFIIDEAYGGGKNAPMDADAKLLMSCIPGLKVAYGGAQNADIEGKVELNITNGTFDRVFGGNNLSGTIRGPIIVNIEETGCRPLIIGELYGGGNEAGYSIYGYKQVNEGTAQDPNLVWRPREATDGMESGYNNDEPFSDPQVNVKSFTSIGAIYGGGYGETATMVGSPTVNINVGYGDWYNYVGESSQYEVAGYDYDATGYKGKTKTISGHAVIIPSHTKGSIGAIQNVYGGGNAAPVHGSTTVNIGTLSDVYVTLPEIPANATLGSGDYADVYTRNNDGTYSAASDSPVAGTTYYKKLSVVGADIRGNVYGGGNAADVTGDTNVVIGKSTE